MTRTVCGGRRTPAGAATQQVLASVLLIPTQPITQSERRRSHDPIEAEHLVHPMASGPSRSEATLVRGLVP